MYDKLPDIQENTKPEVKEYIDYVGIQKVKIPIIFCENHNLFKTVADVSMSVNLPYNVRAASMSEFTRYLKEYIDEQIIIPDDILKLLKSFHKISRSDSWNISTIKFNFDYKRNISSPISENIFPQYYKCFLQFNLFDDILTTCKGLTVPYSSYCPCSKALCDYTGEGIPHAQRSYCDLIVESEEKVLTLDYLIRLVEDCVVNRVYPIIRRIDEKEIAIIASKNTFFVEDIIRNIKRHLKYMYYTKDWIVRLRHEDNIHTHDIVAMSWKGTEGGFNEKTFL